MPEPLDEIEVRHARTFFSAPPFRSVYLIGASIGFLWDISYMLFLACKHWDHISSIELVTFVLVGCFLTNAYRSAFYSYNRLRAATSAIDHNLISDGESSRDVTLSVAATMFFNLSFLFFAVALLLAQIGTLLDHLGPASHP